MVTLAGAVAEANQVRVTNPAELRAAIGAAQPGDQIVLASGVYDTTGIDCSANGTAAAPIVVKSETPLGAEIRFDALEGFHVYGAYWQFDGLTIHGVCSSDDNCEHAFHVVGGANFFQVRNSKVYDFNAWIKVNNSGTVAPDDGLVENNEITMTRPRNTGNPVNGMNINQGDRWIARANYIHDIQRSDGSANYAGFMKGGGTGGVFERNLVICAHDRPAPANAANVGLSFGGGGTDAQFCRPYYDPNIPCVPEQTDGVMKNNIIVNCNDVAVYVNQGKNTTLLYNTFIATYGVDYRFGGSSGTAIGNVMASHIRARDGATFTETNNLMDLTASDFANFYQAPMNGDLRQKGDLSRLIGQGPAVSAISNDFCARQRPASSLTLGAVEHSLGDCDTTHTWPEGGGGGGDGGVPDGGNGTNDAGQSPQDGGPDGGNSGPGGSRGSGDLVQAATHGCGVAPSSASGAWLGLIALLVVSRLLLIRRKVNRRAALRDGHQ